MYQRGIRGAITVKENNEAEVETAVKELVSAILSKNGIKSGDIAGVIFSLTPDIDCVYPAKCCRKIFADWKYVPMMCLGEMPVKNSLDKCLRVLITVNTEKRPEEIHHVYLGGAAELRTDLMT